MYFEDDVDRKIGITVNSEDITYSAQILSSQLCVALKEVLENSGNYICVNLALSNEVENAIVDISDSFSRIAKALEKRNDNEHHQS